MASLNSELWESAKRTYAPVLAMIGVGIAFLPWWVSSSTVFQARWVIVGATIAMILLLVLFDAAFRLNRRSSTPLPGVRAVLAAPVEYKVEGPLLLLEPHPLFSAETAVSIYTKIKGFEVLVGVGTVTTIQQDGAVQVLVMQKHVSPHGDIWDKVQKDQHTAESLIVKPSVTSRPWFQEISS